MADGNLRDLPDRSSRANFENSPLVPGSSQQITSSAKRFSKANEIGPTEPYGQGEVIAPAAYPESSPIFRRVEKVEIVPPTSSKTETVDISPKLAVSDDEDIFWEVTKIPEGKMTQGTTRPDFVDGNHPDLYEVITHDHVDKTTGYSAQSKRVKKILPPFDSKKDETVSESIGKRNTRNISKPKIIAIKVSDLKDINHYDKKVNNTQSQDAGRGLNLTESSAEENEGKPAGPKAEFPDHGNATAETITSAEPDIATSDNVMEFSTVARREPKLANAKGQASSTNAPEAAEPGASILSKAYTTDPQTKDVDVAPEWKNSKTTPLSEWNSTETYEGHPDMKIRNPEFLIVPGNAVEEGDKRETSTPDGANKYKDEEEIRGIPLVPNEFGRQKNEKTTQRSIWDLLNEAKADTGRTTARSLYKNFDAESAEVEYETENFQRGYSNIEKHELPFSYALPWLEVQDKGYDVKPKDQKVVHSKINDFPSILPANRNYFQGGEDVRLPKDLSKLLKLSQNENSVNGVTVSIVDSGTNHEDISRDGHRPSKWYLLLLTGNSTIVKLRRKDFTKYLKLNLAARLSVEYDDIKVNEVILASPKVLVNISVYAPSEDIAEESQFDLKEKFEDKGEAPLYKLAETNATLLELSGEEFHVERFLSLQSQQPEAEAQKDSVPNSVSLAMRHDDVEFIVYIFIGSACACAVVLTFFVTFSKYFKKLSEYAWPLKKEKAAAGKSNHSDQDHDEFNGISPAVIYSGGFPQIRGSWMSGVGSRAHPPADVSGSAPSILKQYPGIELGMSQSQHKNTFLHPEMESRTCSSPRHNKLQIYNSGANNLVLPVPPQKFTSVGTAHPLDVRIPVAPSQN